MACIHWCAIICCCKLLFCEKTVNVIAYVKQTVTCHWPCVQAISNPRSEDDQEKAWQAVCPLVNQLRNYYEFSIALGECCLQEASVWRVSSDGLLVMVSMSFSPSVNLVKDLLLPSQPTWWSPWLQRIQLTIADIWMDRLQIIYSMSSSDLFTDQSSEFETLYH